MAGLSGIAFRVQTLDSLRAHSYMAAIPFHRLTGGALVRAPFFRFWVPSKWHFDGWWKGLTL